MIRYPIEPSPLPPHRQDSPRPAAATRRRLALAGVVTLLTALIGCGSESSVDDAGGSPVDAGADADLNIGFDVPDVDEDVEGDVDDDAQGDALEDAADDVAQDAREWSDTAGGDCFDNSDCSAADGELCVGANPPAGVAGYCTVLDCVTHADCDLPDGGVYCCSNFGAYRGCFREGDDAVCGDESGTQGDDCSQGGQSDCDGTTHSCIQWYDQQFCASYCDPTDPDACGDGWCLPTGGGAGVCLPSGDIEERDNCTDNPEECGENAVCDGAFGEDPSPYAYCAELCYRNRDCADDEWCRIYPGGGVGTCILIGETAEGDSCTEDRWSCEQGFYCLNEGTRFARCVSVCERDTDCDEGLACVFFSEDLGVCYPVGEGETGEDCGADPFSCVEGAFCIGGFGGGYNSDAYCAEPCTGSDTDCPDNFYCADLGPDGRWCLPDGEGDHGDPCDDPRDCSRDTACIYDFGPDGPGQCARICSRDVDCEDGEWCTATDAAPQGFCLPDGDVEQGESCADDPYVCDNGTFCAGGACISNCSDDPESCNEGSYCAQPDVNGIRYCLPFGPTELGKRCTEDFECEPETFCAFRGEAVTGVCSIGCEVDADCPDDFWCLRTPGFNACLPDGDAGQGESCVEDHLSCQAGHFCLFTWSDHAYCARDCTGFPDRCGEGQVCRFIGWNLNICLEVAEGDDTCTDDAVCGPDSICYGAGTADAFCADICTFDVDGCEGEDVCHFMPSGVGICAPADFDDTDFNPGN